jgi:ribonuclease HI
MKDGRFSYMSPLSAVYIVAKERLKPKGSRPPTGNPPWVQPPWTDHSYRVKIRERNQAIKDAATIAGANILGLYADASVTKRLASIAVVRRTGIVTQVVRQDSIGWASTCRVLSAEIAVMSAALEYAQEHLKPLPQPGTLDLVVFSDSQQALRAIQAGNDARIGRALLGKIAESIDALSKAGIDARFRWSPDHEGVVGNEEANDAAREASNQEGKFTVQAREKGREVAGVIRLINRDRSGRRGKMQLWRRRGDGQTSDPLVSEVDGRA